LTFLIGDDERSSAEMTCSYREYDALAYPMAKLVDGHPKFYLRHHRVGGRPGSLQHHEIVGEHPSNDFDRLYRF
jgi:hypothetical protein